MKQLNQYLPYSETGYFSTLIKDFLVADPKMQPFLQYHPVEPGFELAMKAKESQPLHRDVLVKVLHQQYAGLEIDSAVRLNIDLLLSPNTFTICTAHQPNIFTGYLYFAYKILQTVKLAAELKEKFPGKNFVPVYYMGSEDADLDELGKIFLNNKTLAWETTQTGAVGRMKTEGFEEMLDTIQHELGYTPHSDELMAIIRTAYLQHDDIQSATLYLVNALFGRYGLVVLIPDTPDLKRLYIPVMEDELLHQTSYKIVNQTIAALGEHYKVQASPREINLFYLKGDLRERIVYEDGAWVVLNSGIKFNRESLLQELNLHPERFSPNVILRGMFQETILPNIAFLGGGGEVAYWMELKALFQHYRVPYPVVLLRNSFLFIDKFHHGRIQKLGLSLADLFTEVETLINNYVGRHTNANLVLKDEYLEIDALFEKLQQKAAEIDPTLVITTQAEHHRVSKVIGKLEHKFLKAEKKKFAWQAEQIRQIKGRFFPGNSLQERKENFMPFYAQYGQAFFDMILEAMIPVTDQFCVIAEA